MTHLRENPVNKPFIIVAFSQHLDFAWLGSVFFGDAASADPVRRPGIPIPDPLPPFAKAYPQSCR